MSLEQKDIELIERIIYKNSDDVAVSISRSFERLEERIDALEARVSARVTDAEDKIESMRQEFSDELGDVKEELRELGRTRELV
jgi:archaellum component FlaC